MRVLRWAVPIAILAVAALLRFWALGRPGTLVFDELYYVRDAISQLTHGFPTTWPDDEPGMGGGRATAFTGDPSNAVHPPLGKWLIGIGILVFGPDSGWGWRSAAALFGIATVALVMRLGFLVSRSHIIAWLAGLLLALDGVHITLSRVGLLDGFLTFFVVLGAVFMWRDYDQLRGTGTSTGTAAGIAWCRPWLFAAGLTFGAAAAVKWSGLYPLAFFLILTTVSDAVTRFRQGSAHPLLRSVAQAGVAAVIALPTAALAYLASWVGWIVNPGGWGREAGQSWFVSLVRYHAEMLEWHSTLSAPHPYQAHPLSWPLALKPTAMYEISWGRAEGCPWHECVSGITPLPNPIITWAGVIALWVLVLLVVREWRAGRAGPNVSPGAVSPLIMTGLFIVVGYLSGWLPWVLTFSRSAVFQFYAVVMTPFSALALAVVLGLICGVPVRRKLQGSAQPAEVSAEFRSSGALETLQGRRLAVACFLVVSVLLSLLFFPIWSAMPVARWFWQAHLWLPWWS